LAFVAIDEEKIPKTRDEDIVDDEWMSAAVGRRMLIFSFGGGVSVAVDNNPL
jgi:hypothetical protein